MPLQVLEDGIFWSAKYPVPKDPVKYRLFGPQSSQATRILALLKYLEGLAHERETGEVAR